MQNFLVSLAKILAKVGFVANYPISFLGFLSTILKNRAKSCEPCQDLGKKCQKYQNCLGKKAKTLSSGLSCLVGEILFCELCNLFTFC